jgi:iron complex transport system substrate-binding protein
VAGVARAAAPYLAACRSRIATVVARTLPSRHRPLAYVECSPQGHTGGPGSFLHDLVTKAGGASLGALGRVEWPVLGRSTVVRYDPDVIVIARYPGSATADALGAREGWERLSAVKGARVYEVPAGLVKRPGPGLLDGLERLAAIFAAEGG